MFHTGYGFHLFVLTALLQVQPAAVLQQVCVEGFVMDEYCIDRGTLFDNPSVVTLESPERHSVHCLVDVKRCVQSGYNILLLNPKGSPKYGRALKLDDTGNTKVVELARKHGDSTSCKTCSSTTNLTHGFRATFIGDMDTNSDAPYLLKVKTATVSPKLYNHSAVSDGCPGGATELNITLSTESGKNQKPSLAHGSLMIIGWGVLLPTGVAGAHFLKHRPNALWFKIHRVVQVCGLVVAFIGWVIALASFGVFNVTDTSFVHGALGMVVMILGILQPINAFIRPHPPEEGQPRPFKRLLWEIVHKSSGYIAVILAAVTIILGTFLVFSHKTIFRAVWGVSLAWVITFITGSVLDGYRWKKSSVVKGVTNEGHEGL